VCRIDGFGYTPNFSGDLISLGLNYEHLEVRPRVSGSGHNSEQVNSIVDTT
jgi:hypothetical protein